MNKQVLLIEPPFYRLYKDTYSLVKFPLGLGYLSGAILENSDWSVQAYNADFNPRHTEPLLLEHMTGPGFDDYLENLRTLSSPIWFEVEATIRDYGPSVVGISAKSQNFASAIIVAGLAKKIDSNITVVVGGPHASMAGVDLLECSNIDIVVLSEGEETIVDLLRAIEGREDLSTVAGILFRRDSETVSTPQRRLIADLDVLPFPHATAETVLKDYEHYPLSAFRYVFATRGCPYNCMFCGSRNIWSRKVRYRSPANVVDEIEALQSNGLTFIHFDDDTFGISKNYIRQLCGQLRERCPGLTWSCEMVVQIVDDETILWMKDAGCIDIQIGIESGNNGILRNIRKNITIEEAKETAALIRKHGISVQTFFMAGHPDETEETLKDTMRAMGKIKSDQILFSVFTPYPGTDAFEVCKEKGLIEDGYDVSLYNHQSPENCFSAHIPKDRFSSLIKDMAKRIDRLNRRKRKARKRRYFFHRTAHYIRTRGLLYTVGKVLRFLVHKTAGGEKQKLESPRMRQ